MLELYLRRSVKMEGENKTEIVHIITWDLISLLDFISLYFDH